jgi:predicted DNA-binding antitoxin AbrB/MazE fold protein
MTIHAIYENGVFHPMEPVQLPESTQVELIVHTQPTATAPTTVVPPLARLAAIASEHPENPELPNDLAAQHDHYLYGMAKRP